MIKYIKIHVFCVFILVLSNVEEGFSQIESGVIGSKGVAMGGTSVALIDFWSNVSNIAGLVNQETISIGITGKNHYLVKELNKQSIAVIVPVNKSGGVFCTHYIREGTLYYRNQKLAFSYAKKLTKLFSLGLQFDYLNTGSSNSYFANTHTFTFETGLHYSLSPMFTLALHIFNPLPVKYNTNDYLSSSVRVGMAYKNEHWESAFEMETNSIQHFILRAGMEYVFYKKIAARIGVSTNPLLYSFGCGMTFSHIEIGIAAQVHSVLGLSPQLSMSYAL